MYRSIWARDKRLLATKLAKGVPASSYSDAVLVLCATISGFASDVWPGEGRDRARFVQALEEFLPSHLKVDFVSVPLLVGALQETGCSGEGIDQLAHHLAKFDLCRVLTSSDIDLPEAGVMEACPGIDLEVVRNHSYGSLLYRELRCAYSHEYRSGPNASEHPMTSVTNEPVSYVNVVGRSSKQIHFHLEWMGDVVEALAQGLDRAAGTFPRDDPDSWWVYGKAAQRIRPRLG